MTPCLAARKFLLAGKSGMNLTHAEPLTQLLQRYVGGGELYGRQFEILIIRRYASGAKRWG